MDKQKIIFLIINVIGGVAVLGSYVLGLGGQPVSAEALWGGVTPGIRNVIAINMLLAAAGYIFIFFLFLRRIPSPAKVLGLPFWVLHAIYLLILVPAALWMPLTMAMVQNPTPGRWAGVVTALALTGLASIALLLAVLTLRPRLTGWRQVLAILGGAALVLQTAVLDAVVWTISFPV